MARRVVAEVARAARAGGRVDGRADPEPLPRPLPEAGRGALVFSFFAGEISKRTPNSTFSFNGRGAGRWASESGTPPPTPPRSGEGSRKVSPSPLRGGGWGEGLLRSAPPRLREGSKIFSSSPLRGGGWGEGLLRSAPPRLREGGKNLSPSPLRGGGGGAGLLPRHRYPTATSASGSSQS